MESKPIKTLEELNEVIKNEDLSIIRCHASWCAPCKQLESIIEKLDDIEGVQFYDVDVDDSDEIVEKYGVMNVPTTLFFKDNCELDKHIGFMTESVLKNKINENKVK